MAELSVTGAGVAAAGLTAFGVSTGLDPSILIAGFAGGVWAQSYYPPTSIVKRVFLTVLAAILAGYLAPAAASAVMTVPQAREVFTVATLQLPLAVLIGLIAHRVLGPAFMKFAAKKAEDLAK